MSTKIHALVDALGNPTAFALSGGQAHDLVGADQLLPGMEADLLIADKAFDADERVVTLLAQKNKAVVIPPKEPVISSSRSAHGRPDRLFQR